MLDAPRLVSIAVLTGLFFRQLAYVQNENVQLVKTQQEARYITDALPFF